MARMRSRTASRPRTSSPVSMVVQTTSGAKNRPKSEPSSNACRYSSMTARVVVSAIASLLPWRIQSRRGVQRSPGPHGVYRAIELHDDQELETAVLDVVDLPGPV